MPIIQKGTADAKDRSFGLWVGNTGALLFITASVTGVQSFAITPANVIEPGQWHHFAGVVDRSMGRMEIYLDGDGIMDPDHSCQRRLMVRRQATASKTGVRYRVRLG